MPRPNEISITANRELAARWQRIAQTLGWGERGRFKFLRVLLEFVEENQSLFRKR